MRGIHLAVDYPVKWVKKTHRGQRSSAGTQEARSKEREVLSWCLRIRLCSSELWKQQIAMLLHQVMEVSDRLRQNEESSEQVRQLLEAHRTAGQMLVERKNRTEASARDISQAGGNGAARAQESPGADDGRFGFGAFAARYQPGELQW